MIRSDIMIGLTKKQQEILTLIANIIKTTGCPPTRSEIAQHMGYRSINAAEEHLQALARKGAINLSPGTSRGIRLPKTRKTPVKKSDKSPAQPTQMQLPNADIMQLSLPLVGRVAAGSPILAVEHIGKIYNVDPSLFTDKPDFLLKVRGMSMRDAGIFDGDLLAVKKTTEIRSGQIIVARIGEDVTVKRYLKNGNKISLMPENSDYAAIHIRQDDQDFHVEGIAVGLMRSWH